MLTFGPLASGFLSGRFRKDRPIDLTIGRAALTPSRFDPTVPENVAKFEAVEQLAALAEDIGCSLPELAVAFPTTHPSVTSVITGPRTMEQLDTLLKGASLTLDDATLDRIDEIVPPGTNLYQEHGPLIPAAVTDPDRRRRPISDRAAGS